MNTIFSKNIENLIKDIQQQNFLTNSLILEIVENNHISENDITQYISYHHSSSESYGRQLIYDNGNFKILLMSWKSGDFTAIHNHGYTEWGCVSFFGETTHRLYNVTNNELKIAKKDNFQKGQTISTYGNLTHIMGNLSTENFTTFHIYGTNTRNNDVSKNTVVYIPEWDKEVTTMGSAFLNMNKQLTLSEKPMIKIGNNTVADYLSLVKPFYERNGLVSVLKNMETRLEIGNNN